MSILTGKRIIIENCKVITYLPFNGSCEEAVNAYIRAFGGRILFLSRWDERNCENKNQHGKVMHTEFLLGETHMAAGDSFEAEVSGKGIKLMVHMETESAALEAIKILSEGGSVISKLTPHPKPDDSGMGGIAADRYGFTWIITCPNPHKQDSN